MWTRRQFVGAVAASGVVGAAFAAGISYPAVAAVSRRALRVVPSRRTLVGQVFKVRRTIPGESLDQVDPFLLLDHFDFTLKAGELGGLAPHPHKGIETVTVLLEGAIEHGDSLGNRAVLEAGGVQWMTAASGIVHEENPADILRERGGRVHGVQLWVNLPARSKTLPPGYQDRPAAKLPSADSDGVRVRVIAGAVDDVASPLITQTPLALFDVAAPAGARVTLAQPPGWTGFVHVVEGDVDVAGAAVGEATLAELDTVGDSIVFTAGSRGARALVGGGLPIAEPLARRGPFAMNTQAELDAAFAEYRAGKMGRVPNPTYDRIRLP
jgi:redox-sensitive bicupin YhaK (pirin superfamily)